MASCTLSCRLSSSFLPAAAVFARKSGSASPARGDGIVMARRRQLTTVCSSSRNGDKSPSAAVAGAPGVSRDPIRNEALFFAKLNPDTSVEEAVERIAAVESAWAAKAASGAPDSEGSKPFASVLEIMTPIDDVETLRSDEGLNVAVARFLETGVHAMPVLGPEGSVRGGGWSTALCIDPPRLRAAVVVAAP